LTQINWQHDMANRLHRTHTRSIFWKERCKSEWKFIFIEIKYLMLEWAFKIIMLKYWNLPVCNKMLLLTDVMSWNIQSNSHFNMIATTHTAIAAGCFNINRKWVVIEIILPITHSINICVKVQSGNVCTSVGCVEGGEWPKNI
jgi:hypothetical protein